MKEVSPGKFEALVAKNIVLKPCRCGAQGGNIVVQMPWYGQVGARVECRYCNRRTKLHGISVCIMDTENSVATPIIEKSMMNGIRHAVTDWNEGRYEY